MNSMSDSEDHVPLRTIKGRTESTQCGTLGTLWSLQDLENKSIEALKAESSADYLKKNTTRLQKRKVELQRRIAAADEMLRLVHSQGEPSELRNEDVTRLVGELETKKLQEIALAYRLTGVTVSSLAPNTFRLNIDVFFEGVHADSNLLELIQDGATGKVKVTRHTFPYFVSLGDIVKKNDTNIGAIGRELQALMQAYTTRRNAAIHFQEKYTEAIDEEICLSHGFDVIQFTVKRNVLSSIDAVLFHLTYDPRHILPKDVQVSFTDGATPRLSVFGQYAAFLREFPLMRAMEEIILP